MSRRNGAQYVLAQPDPIYESRLVSLLVVRIMKSGKKSIAQRIVYKSLEIIAEKTEENPIRVLERAARNAAPRFGLGRSRRRRKRRGLRRRKRRHKVPVKIRAYKGITTSLKWIVHYSREHAGKAGKNIASQLAVELMTAAERKGKAVKKRQQSHRRAKAVRHFARWWYPRGYYRRRQKGGRQKGGKSKARTSVRTSKGR
jgi:small subunit ribosomal protein S7